MASGNWVIENLEHALETWNSALGRILQLLIQTPENFNGGGIWRVIVSINGALQAAGLGLLVLFFCMSIFKTASSVSELKRPEAAVKMFVRFALAKAAITYCMEIMMALFSICQGVLLTVLSQLGALDSQASTLPADVAQKITEAKFMESIPLWIVTLLGSIFIIVLTFIMLLTVYGRFFKIYMYTAIAPIPLSTFAGEGTSHIGKSFLKSYAGVCMEGVIVALACIIFSAFASSPPTSIGKSVSAVTVVMVYIIELVFNLLVLVGTVKMAERLTKEMLGL